MKDASFDINAIGKAWDTPAASFVSDEEYLIGIEITDMDGRLPNGMLGVFCICGFEGTKAFLTATQAREFAAEILNAAAMIDAGATSMEKN